MSLLQQIKSKSVQFRKNKDPMAVFLITLYSESSRPGLDDGKRESTDEEVIRVLKKFKDGAKMVMDNSSSTTAETYLQAQQEILLIDDFLPRQMTSDELHQIIKNTIDTGVNNLGGIMKYLNTHHAGLYDGALASQITRQLLAV